MMFRTLFAGVALAALGVDAQTTTSGTRTSNTASATSSSSSGPATHVVQVAAALHRYTDNNIKANVGDTVRFVFYPGNHSVVRAAFGEWRACIPYEYSDVNRKGFFSGHQNPPILTSEDNLPKFDIKINDTEPIFYYCSAPVSCTQWVMIGVINENATHTLAKQEAFVRQEGVIQLSPGDPFPSEYLPTTPVPTNAAPAPTSTTPTTGGGQQPASNSGSSDQLSSGAIAGISIGGAAVLILAGALIWYCGRQSRGGDNRQSVVSQSALPPRSEAASPYRDHPMAEAALYAGAGPKSPGQSSFTSYPQSVTPANAPPYTTPPPHVNGAGIARNYTPPPGGHPSPPHDQQGFPRYSAPPSSIGTPPLSPQAYPTFSTFQNLGGTGGGHQPGLEVAGYGAPQQGRDRTPEPPVELPASSDPGNSPLPKYQNGRKFSFAEASEASYRPSKP